MKEFINKLISRLEEKKSEHLHDEEVTQGLGRINLASFCSAKARALDGAIKIVNELAEEYINTSTDTSSGYCEWKLIDEEKSVYKSGCEKQRFYDGNPTESMYEFCPYCGKKIKVVK